LNTSIVEDQVDRPELIGDLPRCRVDGRPVGDIEP
jgi:hypothetical protein